MDKKKYIIAVIAVALICGLAVWGITSHNKPADNEAVEEQDPDDLTEDDDLEFGEDEGNGIVFEEESDGAVIVKVNKDPSDYVGKWEATSDMAKYLYGSIDITVKKDGTWEANITGETLGGDWVDKGDHLHMNDTVGEIFSFDLAFDQQGNLIMIDSDSEEDGDIYTVLTKK